MSQFFASGAKVLEFLAAASVLPMNIQDWSPLESTGWISLHQGTLKSLPQHHGSKASVLRCSAFFIVQLSHPYLTTGKTIALTRRTFVGKVMSLLFNMLSRLVITFLPRNKHLLLISWLQSPFAVILEPPKIKSATVSTVSPSTFHEVMAPDALIFVFWMLSFKPTFSFSSLKDKFILFRCLKISWEICHAEYFTDWGRCPLGPWAAWRSVQNAL